jgi:hypothetical protein
MKGVTILREVFDSNLERLKRRKERAWKRGRE